MPEGAEAAAIRAIPRGKVREACLDEALAIIAEGGVEALSFREVSRRLGVSHQAPYRHFASRDAIVAELMTRCFGEFAEVLVGGGPHPHPGEAMRAMGEAYLLYARQNPAKYALMFETPMPQPSAYPAMMREARRAFGLLKERLAAMQGASSAAGPDARVLAFDALFVWSVVHGLAAILKSDVFLTLGFKASDRQAAIGHCLGLISRALGGEHDRG